MLLAAYISSTRGRAVSYPSRPNLRWAGRLGSTLTLTSPDRFHGFTENSREVDMDMKEMVDKVKKGEPLYGSSQVSTYLQGVAARNSRYANLFVQVIPWFNLVNHEHVSLCLHSKSLVCLKSTRLLTITQARCRYG